MSDIRVKQTYVFVCTALMFIVSCTGAPPIREEGRPAERAPVRETIRIAVMQYEQPVHILVEDGSIDAGTDNLSLGSPQTLTVDGDSLHVAGKRLSLPATIQSSQPLVIDGRVAYGHLRIQDGYLISIVPVEIYTIGVLHGEVPASWPVEALKAQAVVSRTYAYSHILKNRDELFDAGSTHMFQKYDYTVTNDEIERAVQSTRDEILFYQDQPIEVFFHSCSGGRTESCKDVFQRDLPYLRSIPDPYCAKNERFFWSYSADAALIGTALREAGVTGFDSVDIRDIHIAERTGSGRVRIFAVRLSNGDSVVVQGNTMRIALDPTAFKSLLITKIEKRNTGGQIEFTFHGRGYGHGVGMSQWGAKEMAYQGFSYKHILKYYYRGTRIGSIWDIR